VQTNINTNQGRGIGSSVYLILVTTDTSHRRETVPV